MTNNAVSSTISLPTGGAGWKLDGIADVDGDGSKDIVVSNPGYSSQWVYYYRGTTMVGSNWAPHPVSPDAALALGGDGGTDTVQSSIGYTLPDGVENLTLTGSGNLNGTGNAADNVIVGNSGNNVLKGLGGADTLTGGLGSDAFVFATGFGRDTITDFAPGTDLIQFDHALFTDAANVISHTVDDGLGNAIIAAMLADVLTVQNVTTATLQQHLNDFHIV